MMTRQDPVQSPLFRPGFDLGSRVPKGHLLRRIQEAIDFNFVYNEVEDSYGAVGNPSVPPPVILKLLLLLFFERVRSERVLMETLPMRLDWLWFMGYELDTPIPNHSVLSKARTRWGAKRFKQMFRHVLDQCSAAGLIGGEDVFVDSSLIDADASIDSLFARTDAEAIVADVTARLDEVEAPSEGQSEASQKTAPAVKPAKYTSNTDPDATGTKHGADKMRPRYATHRIIDDLHGVITGTVLGPGHQDEGERFIELIDQHVENTGKTIRTATADSKYGRLDNYEACEAREIEMIATPRNSAQSKGKPGHFGDCDFLYDETKDRYVCPAGEVLTKGRRRADRNGYLYTTKRGVCDSCPVRDLCTTAKNGRAILRVDGRGKLDAMFARARSDQGRERRRKRFWMMEGSFATSSKFGFKRARWRGLERVAIQDFLVATLQNILLMTRKGVTRKDLDQLHRHVLEFAKRLHKFSWNKLPRLNVQAAR